jgi:putative oxidoreductase
LPALTEAVKANLIALLPRIMVGVVFLSEGVQKFLSAEKVGAGRFERIGLPFPEVLAPFVAPVEMLCGAMLLAGIAVRMSALPLLAIMIVALLSTKLPILLNEGFWAMVFGLILIILMGAGEWKLKEIERSSMSGDQR